MRHIATRGELFERPHSRRGRVIVVRQCFLRHSLVGDGDYPLDAPFCSDQLVLQVRAPEPECHEVAEQVLVDHGELSAEDSSHVDVARVWLEALVVAEDLRV